jgi:tetratricopeptide (TPR) repeat protein
LSFFRPVGILAAAERYRASGAMDRALPLLESAGTMAVADPEVLARSRLYSVYARGSVNEGALPALRELVVQCPAQTRVVGAAYLNMGERLSRAGRALDAARALHRVHDARPGVLTFELQAARRLAECYTALNDAEMTSQEWHEALAIAESRAGVPEFDEVGRLAREALRLPSGALAVTNATAAPASH